MKECQSIHGTSSQRIDNTREIQFACKYFAIGEFIPSYDYNKHKTSIGFETSLILRDK